MDFGGDLILVAESNNVSVSSTQTVGSMNFLNSYVTGFPAYNDLTTATQIPYTNATGVPQTKVFNVKSMVDEIFASGNWAYGERINFWIYANSAFGLTNYGHVGQGTPARLEILV